MQNTTEYDIFLKTEGTVIVLHSGDCIQNGKFF